MLMVLAAPKGSAAAPLPNRAAVFVYAKDGNDGAAGRTEIQLTRALDDAQVNVADVNTLFPPPAPDTETDQLLKAAREAWDNLDYEAAAAKYQQALEHVAKNPASTNSKKLGEIHFFLGVLTLTNQGKSQAKKVQEEFAQALIDDPETTLDARTYGTDAKKVFDKAKKEVAGRGQGAIHVETTPGGADVYIHGERTGLSPLSDAPIFTVGHHLVTATRAGYEPAGAIVDLPKDGASTSLKLKPAQNYGEVRSVANDVVASGVGSGKVPGGAKRLGELMKSRYLVVAKVSDGAGTLEVWDVETSNQINALSISDEASLASAVAKVKQFMASPSPVVAAAASTNTQTSQEATLSEPIFTKWWFWTAVGVVVVGGATAGTIAAVSSSNQGRPFNVVLGSP